MDTTGNIYVTNGFGGSNGLGSVAVFPAGSYGTGSPSATIAGDNTGLDYPFGVGVDSNGDVSVLNADSTITVYPAGSTGNVPPRATINIDGEGEIYPSGLAVDHTGKIYVANRGTEDCNEKGNCIETNQGSVAVYPAESDGIAKASAVIAGPLTKLGSPSAIAVDHSGDIYVANQGHTTCTRYCGCFSSGFGSVTEYEAGSNGDAKPIARIVGTHTGIGSPYGIALDSSENIYVLNFGNFNVGFILGSTRRFGACLSQNYSSSTATSAPATSRVATSSVATLDGVGFFYPILIFAAGSNGDAAPIAGIGGPFIGFYGPEGIAIGPTGSP